MRGVFCVVVAVGVDVTVAEGGDGNNDMEAGLTEHTGAMRLDDSMWIQQEVLQ